MIDPNLSPTTCSPPPILPPDAVALPHSEPPTRYIIPNDAITNALPQALDYGACDLTVGHIRGKDITAYVDIYSNDADDANGTVCKYTAYDRCIYNAICTLCHAGRHIMTDNIIYRAMSGNRSSTYVSPQAQAQVAASVARLGNIHIYADVTEQMQQRKISVDNTALPSWVIDAPLIDVTPCTIAAGGRSVAGYALPEEPVLLRYAMALRQIINVDAQLMDIRLVNDGRVTESSIATTTQRQAIKEYLLRRIAVMRRDATNKRHKQRHRILMTSLYDAIDMGSGCARPQLYRLRQYIDAVLRYWTAIGYIAGHSIVLGGKTNSKQIAIDIQLRDNA